MKDTIYRADAIEAVRNEIQDFEKNYMHGEDDENFGHDIGFVAGLHRAKEFIRSLPSAEAVQGEWIDIDNYYRMATCSNCHKVTMFEKWGEYTKPYDFCPNCGAKMKGGEDE